jgi:hypothetical protein
MNWSEFFNYLIELFERAVLEELCNPKDTESWFSSEMKFQYSLVVGHTSEYVPGFKNHTRTMNLALAKFGC